MKKFVAIVLVAVMAIGLCACGSSGLSAEEKALVGEWTKDTTTNETTMVLTDSGRGMRWMGNNSGDAITWEVFDGMLYTYDNLNGGSGSSSYRYVISGNNLLDSSGNVLYTKK